MAPKWRVLLRGWFNSVGDIIHYLRSRSTKGRLGRGLRIGAGLICLWLAGYLVMINLPGILIGPVPSINTPAEEEQKETVRLEDSVSVPEPATGQGVNLDSALVTDFFPELEKPQPGTPAGGGQASFRTPAPSAEPRLPQTVDPADMSWPVAGRISTGYGWFRHPTLRDWRFCPGIIVAAPEGVPVRAALPGRVTRVEYTADWGLVVVIEHGGNWRTTYGYLLEAAVAGGDHVAKGQTVGRVGTPAEGESALFFAVEHEGEAVDPRAFLR